jgi:L-amino acid N-acyltransferase YncA
MPTPTIAIYPKPLILKDHTEVKVRPMRAGDEQALLAFFLNLSEEERFCLKDDVTAPGVLDRWVRELDYERVLPLIAVATDGRIVADASLHRRRGGGRRHVGEVRVTVDAAFRGQGLGSAILHEVIDYANQMDLEALTFELVDGEQTEAIDAARRAGFSEAARIVNHVKDMEGNLHDLVILRMPLGKWYTWW